MANKPTRKIDYMARDYESYLASMRALIPDLMPEWTDYAKETDLGNVLLQLFAHTADTLSYYQDRLVNESFLGTARERRSIIDHLDLIGYQLATASPASTELRLSFPGDCVDTVRIRKGNAFATKSGQNRPSIRFEYTGSDFDLDCSALAIDAESGRKHYGLLVEEGKLIREDSLGFSDGSARQRFALSFSPLILRSLGAANDVSLWTELGGVIDPAWRRQDTLAFSLENAKDYVIDIDDRDQAFVSFGGNGFGAVVPSGAEIKVQYRIGGGRRGNVSAHTITTISDASALNLLGAQVTNPDAATGGADRESIDAAVAHAPAVFRSMKRAVTGQDYEALALNFSGVGKVRAEVQHWNRVSLFIAPQGGGRVSDVLKGNLLAYFEDKRPLSTLITIEDVDYVKIYVSATVGIASYYAKLEMQEKIQAAVNALLDFDAVDFAQTLYLSKFYEAIEAIEGITFVTITEFARQGGPGPEDDGGKIQLRSSEVPRVPGVEVTDAPGDLAYQHGLRIVALEGGY